MTDESVQSEKKLSEAVKVNIAIAMAGLLVTTSAITLPMMVAVSELPHKYLNDIFWIVGLGSLVTSSLLIDSVLDEKCIDFKQRLELMGCGYLAFSLLVSFMSIAVTALFFSLEMDKTQTSIFSIPFLFFVFGGSSIFVKMMTNNDRSLASWGIIVSFTSSYVLILFPCIWS